MQTTIHSIFQLSDTGITRTGTTFLSAATFLTSQSLSCSVTGTLPLTVLLISVSNNGVNKSSETMYIIQDPVCYDCDAAARQCTLQVKYFKYFLLWPISIAIINSGFILEVL